MSWPRLQESRLITLLIGAMAGMAWCALWIGEKSIWGHHLLHGAIPPSGSRLAFAAAFVAGWTIMTIAMMLPTTSPLILLFHGMTRSRQNSGWLATLLVIGYLLVWLVFGALIYVLNRTVHSIASDLAWFASHPAVFPAGILLAAGLYQFSSLKYACLDECRSPLAFILSRWHGKRQSLDAFRIGAEHGIYCVGCCWSLMLVMFATSTASFAWMLGLGAVMAAEKNLPFGRRLSAPVGALLICAAAAVLVFPTN